MSADGADEVPDLRPRRRERERLALTRFAILRLLGLVYACAFLVLFFQAVPLFGHHGILPADEFLEHVRAGGYGFWKLPSIFWLGISDELLRGLAGAGVVLGVLCALGFTNSIALLVLWALYLSFVHVGQVWMGYGWDIQLCETGLLAVFLAPALDPRPIPARQPPRVVVWLFRWLIVRIMLGAALIKLRGDECWRELTCLDFHFETQPLPNTLSPFFHAAPHWAHAAGVLFNHAAELVAPILVFTWRPLRRIAGAVMLAFQITLILSGNLSFLNWLTIVPILACFDDGVWRRVLPDALVRRAEAAAPAPRRAVVAGSVFAALVAFLSIDVVMNLLSREQRMNSSFEPFEVVNTYGAFGSVGRERDEIVFEGTTDATPGPSTHWLEYDWKCKPGDPNRRPCWVSPYHLRLDWQIWFAAMESPEQAPWTLHFVWRLLHADADTLGLLDGDPFHGEPPRWIRARLYRYELQSPGAASHWRRTLIGEWLPPLSTETQELRDFLTAYGWY